MLSAHQQETRHRPAQCRTTPRLTALLVMATSWIAAPGWTLAATLTANPATYLSVLTDLAPGDHLRLEPGVYRDGMKLQGLHGEPGRPIVISGPADRTAAFLGRQGRNTIELRDVSHLEIRNLRLDGQNLPGVDGVKSHEVSHHITLENLLIINHGPYQQTVGISTKAAAWNWILRRNTIRGAGTGIYLGNSDGSAPFLHGLIEHNLIAGTTGYGLQIKHQSPRPPIEGMPAGPGTTVIRHNIISKAQQPTKGLQGARPNLLVGHFPLSGPGVEDSYEIYGNLLYQNLLGEPLFQGEGNISFHDNLLINHHGDGLWIQAHNDRPRRIAIFHNTVVAKGLGILVKATYAGFPQQVVGNAVFAQRPIRADDRWDNFTASYRGASDHLNAPLASSQLDLRPRPGHLLGAPIDLAPLGGLAGPGKDFAGNPRDGTVRGAYAGADVSRGALFDFLSAL